jgi:hypothetical protein
MQRQGVWGMCVGSGVGSGGIGSGNTGAGVLHVQAQEQAGQGGQGQAEYLHDGDVGLNGFDQWFRSVVVDVEQDVDCYGSGEEGGDDRDENVRALVAHVEVVVAVAVALFRLRIRVKSAEIVCIFLDRSHCRNPLRPTR